jgi:hypothetical protein
MWGFSLFSKVAFICNICFLLVVILQRTGASLGGEVYSLIIVMGYILAIIMNALVSLWYLWLRRFGRPLRIEVPSWLIITNFFFLAVQLILLFR